MRNLNDEENDYNYSPNELAELSNSNPKLYDSIISSNLEKDDNVKDWQERNRNWARECLAEQRYNRRR